MKFRKTAAVLLTGAFVIGMGSNAMAMEQSRVPSVNSGSVYGTYVPGQKADTVYNVNIEWGAMDFTYTAGDEGTWNPETHEYEGATEGTWTSEGNEVTVTNHSNAPVGVKVYFKEEVRPFQGITGTVTNSEYQLESAVGKSVEKADSRTSALTLSGEMTDTEMDHDYFGSINVALSVVK